MRRTRLHRVLPALVLAGGLLTACGEETTSDGSDRKPDVATEESPRLTPRTASFAVLDDARAELALLSQGNLGAAFEADPSSDEADDPDNPGATTATGCESDVSFEDRLDPEGLSLGDADIDYWMFDDVRLMAVTSVVSSFGDEATAEAAFEALYADIGECTHFEDASEDGTETTVIDVTVDTDPATGDVDDQFDMVGGGSWSFDGQNIPLGVGFAIARIDSNITMVMLLSIGVTEDNELLAPYTEIAADRLVQVAAGETPEDVAAPLPSATPQVKAPIERTPASLADFYAAAPGILGD
ncbi:hypothetical protein [Nocardioides dilutus]